MKDRLGELDNPMIFGFFQTKGLKKKLIKKLVLFKNNFVKYYKPKY
jgi:hypothetical protein